MRAFLVVVLSKDGTLRRIDAVFASRADAEKRVTDIFVSPDEVAVIREKAVFDKSRDDAMADVFD